MSRPETPAGKRFVPRLTIFPAPPAAEGGDRVEAVYPLSPMQQGMLFNSLLDPGAGVEIEQLVFRLRETVDADALAAAWRDATERHPILRTAFRWEKVEVPVQEVHASVRLPFEMEDWSGVAADGAEERLGAWLRADRLRGIPLAEAPLQRVTLIRRAADDWTMAWTFHHALLDGRAMVLVLSDVFAAYEARRDGRDAALPPARPYRDYVDWLTARDFGESEGFWRALLDGFTPPTPLPAAQPAARDGPEEHAQHSLRLSPGRTAELERMAAERRLTLNTLVQAAWGVLLARHSGVSDVVFGTTRACRRSAAGGAETIVGPVFNSLPLRLRLLPGASLLECAEALRAQSIDVRPHEHTPLQRIQEWCGAAGTPLFQTLVVFENRGMTETLQGLGGGWHARDVRILRKSSFPLTLSAYGEAGLLLTVTCDPSRYDEATVRRLLRHLRVILEAFAADPHQAAEEVEFLGGDERRMLAEWNATDAAFPPDATLHGMFATQARRTPDAIAVRAGDVHLTYAELDARAEGWARQLRTRGVGPEMRVALCLDRSPALVTAILAVLKAGGAYVPLDPASPADRVEFFLADCGAPLLLTRAGLLPPLDAVGVEVLDVAADPPAMEPSVDAVEEGARTPEAGPENAAYVIYTSGSTGKPKGVVVEHARVVGLVHWHLRAFGVTASDRAALLAGVGFDASTWELWPYLAAGASLHVVPDAVRAEPFRLRDWLVEEGITIGFAPTPLAEALLALEWPARPAMRTLLTGGDTLRTRPGARLPFTLVNNYGPTECTVVATSGAVPAEAEGARTGPLSIGGPIGNVRAHVLEGRTLRPAPLGAPGELYLGGTQVARCYLGRAALTAERFVPDPFSPVPGARMYRTGDRARWRTDGTLEFQGRLDEQVKIRGFRVEPGEVESALLAHPAVREATVVAREDLPGDRRLAAYVVADVSVAELRVHLRSRLPEYMVPSALVPLERLPVTPNGKVDRRALRALPAPDRGAEGASFVAPRTPVEEALAATWADVLGVERVGIHDNFFVLGGHSLLAARVAGRVREVLGAVVPLRTFFDAPTVAGVAAAVAEGADAARDDAPLLPVPRDRPLPPSFAQERLWMVERMEGGGAYNVPRAWRLAGPVDAAALDRALTEIVRRHEALRTVFRTGSAGDEAMVLPAPDAILCVDEVTGRDPAAREREAARLVQEEAARRFDLAAGPLHRFHLLRLSGEEHILLFVFHHVVIDGWSLGVFLRELAALYAAFSRGAPSPLAPLPVQYADYAAWQRARLRGHALRDELAWWTRRLAGAPALLELPLDRPRPAVRSQAGARETIAFPVGLRDRLEELARAEGATLYMVLLAAFQVLLFRCSGSDDLVVGSPIAGRTRAEVEELVGFFVNTLVLRTDLSGDPTFREVLRRVRTTTLGAFEHQEVPFEKLVEELQPERSLSHTPLVQVIFSLREGVAAELALTGLDAVALDVHTDTAKFDLALAVDTVESGLRGELAYATDLFDAETIRRMLARLGRVLEEAAADPDRRLSALELLPDAEREFLASVGGWNRTEAAHFAGACIHRLFEARAVRTPDAVALVCEDRSLTYRELNTQANRLAHRLIRLGVEPDARVAMCFERGAEMVVSLLGILKAGGAYVALDTALPAERLRHMLCASRAAALVVPGELAGSLPAETLPVVRMDTALAAEPADDPRVPVRTENLAYVIFTSGSTGAPKGVGVEHRQLVSYVHGLRDRLGLPEGASYATVSTLSADLGNTVVFSALAWGGTLHVIAGERILGGDALGEYFARHPVDCLKITPSHLAALQAGGDPRRVMPRRWLVLGGESSSLPWVDELVRMAPECAVFNHYGPTETTVGALAFHATGERPETPSQTLVLGRTLPGYQVFVVDAALRPVPVGVPGELLIGGSGVARGYLDRPDLTAERFVANPFGAGRLYRTGDRCRLLPDGNVEFLGRMDQQVKIRGFRVEPGEIEAALRDDPAVAACAVVAREDVPGEKRLVAYVVGAANADALRARLRRTLPEYMVPAAFVPVDHVPLTPNGKLDRHALPAPAATVEDGGAAPRTPTEELLAAVWAEVLRMDRVGVEENFFALGGHSLLATRVVSRVREVFGVELPVRALFEGPTVAQVAERVDALRREGVPALPPIVPVARTGALPLSFAQERLWFLAQLEGPSAAYNVPSALRLRGALDVAALERALGEVARRHEVLRTTFRQEGEAPVQVVAAFSAVALPVEDIASLDAAAREARVRQRAAEDAARPFDLAAGPLFRASLLRVDAEEHVLLLCMHHVVSDAWSRGVLSRELAALYRAYRSGVESPLTPLAVQYADYAVWQREQLRGPALERQLAYWKRELAGAPALLDLPTDHPRPAVLTYRGDAEPVAFSGGLLARLEALARGEGATLYMVLLAAFQVLLGRYAGTGDIVVGSPIAGRTRRETEELIGFFVNTLALRTNLEGAATFREVLRRVRRVTLGAYEHQDVPFERLVAELQLERSRSHGPLFQVMFILQNADRSGGGLDGIDADPLPAETHAAKFDLTLALEVTGGALRGELGYSTDLYERPTILRMLGHLERVLEQVADDPDASLARLEFLPPAERARVVDEWNRTGAAYPAEACIHTLFQAQALRTPDAVAALHEHDAVTYAELNARANRLAHHLAGLGVGPEVRVGICLERGVELLVALLAVLKAGGAYVPLDPAYPVARLGMIVADAGAPVLVTQEKLRGLLPARQGVRVVGVDTDAAAVTAESATDPASGVCAGNLAYLIYTSGSTGRPKGVAIEHASVVALLAWGWGVFSDEELSGMLASTSICFDLSVFEIFLPLSRGGRVIVVENALALPSSAAAGEVRLVNTVPSAAAALLRSGGIPPGVRTINLAGEPLKQPLVDALYAVDGIERVYDLYGPSEDTTYSTFAVRAAGGRANIGRCIANSRGYVLDAELRPVPAGVAGELYLGGAGVTRGYLGRPVLTAERYLPDHLGGVPGGRLYRTGDRVRWRADGTLEYLGRLDDQVKVRGFRIEPGEIDATLRRHPGVRDCAVVVRDDGASERRLVAYFVGEAEVEALRAHLRRTVPEYMVPGAFVRMEALPLTPNGKVDRKALPAPEIGPAADGYVAPGTLVEAALAGIWAEVLGVERVGVRDDFFQLGGHSLLATRLVWRIRESLDGDLDLGSLFETPTIAGLAPRLSPRLAPPGPGAAVPTGTQRLLDLLDDLSDDELDRLMSAQLENPTLS